MRFEQDEMTPPRRHPPRSHARVTGGDRDRATASGSARTSGTRRCRRPRARPRTRSTQPRPGHADLAGMQKYGFDDARDVLERASARETAARVAAGTLAKAAPRHPRHRRDRRHVIQMGAARARRPRLVPVAGRSRDRRRQRGALLRRRCRSGDGRRDQGRRQGGRLASAASSRCWPTASRSGSAATCTGTARSTRLLAQALMSIQAVKGVEIGDGFEVAAGAGSEAHDPIAWSTQASAYVTRSPLGPAASRAACPPASCSSPGRP